MNRAALSVKTDDLAQVRRTLWAVADEVPANSTLSPAEMAGSYHLRTGS
jgi:hypothetical protein